MIKWIKVRNPYNEELTVTLTESEPSHGLLVKEITGLGSKASLSFTDYVILDGSVNTNRRVEKRTIGLDFILAFAPDIESSRRNVYRYFPIKGSIRLWIGTDYRTSYIDGIVESIEPGIFSENEEVNVSIVCEDPYFRSNTPILNLNLDTTFGSGKKFEFPFENNSLDEKLIEFGKVIRTTPYSSDSAPYISKDYILTYEGDVPTGAVFKFFFKNMNEINTSLSEGHKRYLCLWNISNDEKMYICVNELLPRNSSEFQTDTEYALVVSTIKNDKKVYWYKNIYPEIHDDSYIYVVTPDNKLGAFMADYDWLTIIPGNNMLLCGITSILNNPPNISFNSKDGLPVTKVEYYNLYQGA